MTTSQEKTATPGHTDIRTNGWLMSALPGPARPYARLMRLDRPIGTWLLLLPGWWSLALSADLPGYSLPWGLMVLFGIGALAMRGAGCVYNDIIDREFDAKVERTAARPIPAGDVTVFQAWVFLGALLTTGFLVLITMNWLTIGLGVAALALVAAYPFMKRITYWPQAWLGLTFNWGAIMGWAAATGSVGFEAVLLYAAGIAWTLGYDTIYAHQDKEDDALIGVKSTALALGERTRPALWVFYGLTAALTFLVGVLADLSDWYFGFWAAGIAHLFWQIRTLRIDDPMNCLERFKSNRYFGFLILVGVLTG